MGKEQKWFISSYFYTCPSVPPLIKMADYSLEKEVPLGCLFLLSFQTPEKLP